MSNDKAAAMVAAVTAQARERYSYAEDESMVVEIGPFRLTTDYPQPAQRFYEASVRVTGPSPVTGQIRSFPALRALVNENASLVFVN